MSDDNIKWIDIGEKMTKQMLEKKQKNMETLITMLTSLQTLFSLY